MKALIIYESMFGNTRDVAMAIDEGLRRHAEVEAIEVGNAPDMIPMDIDLLVVGGPTHQFGMSRASSRESAASQTEQPLVSAGRGVREWLEAVESIRPGMPAAAFDTTMKSPRFLKYFGSASGSIMKLLRSRGFAQAVSPERFWVDSGNGPLAEGEAERARAWAEALASQVPATGKSATAVS